MLSLRSGLSALVLLLTAAPAFAGPNPSAGPPKAHPPGHGASRPPMRTARLESPAARPSSPLGRSVGSPTEGHLIGGAHLADGPHLRIVPVYATGDARWGLEPLVTMIDHAAKSVRKQFPDAVLSVGHLSRAGGGEIDRHASHESGRDADIGFYVRNHLQKPVYADHFVAFRGDGTAPSWPGAQFDDARNWALVSAIASDPHARVSHIFVATPLRQRLLSYAERVGAPLAVRTRASELMAQPKGSLPHDDHFHVRIACPPGMEQCIEQPIAKKHSRLGQALAHAKSAAGHLTKPPPQIHPPGHGQAHAFVHPPAAGHAKSAPPAAPPPAKEEPAKEDKSEALVPSLAPMVPGLDAALIPAPLLKAPPAGRPVPVDPGLIDDPDGVLEP